MKDELVKLRSAFWNFMRVVEKKFALPWSPGLFTLNCNLLKYLVNDLKMLGRLLSTGSGQCGQFNVLAKKCYGMTSQRSLTRIRETVENMRIALDGVQRPEKSSRRSTVHAPVLEKRQCTEHGGRHLVRVEVCVLLGQLYKEVERAEAGMRAE